MNRNGYWIRLSIPEGEVLSLIKVENDYEDYRWSFELEEFVKLANMVPDIGMSDEYDLISEEEALEYLGRTSWGDED